MDSKQLEQEFIRVFRKNCRTTRVDLKRLELLLDKGADINTKDANGYTALAYACMDNDREFLEFVLEKGADINLTYNKCCKENILHMLARRCSRMMDIVCKYNVSRIINERDGHGMTPLDIVKNSSFCGDGLRKELVDILRTKGGKESKDILSDMLNKKGDKLLMDCTYSENLDLITKRGISK